MLTRQLPKTHRKSNAFIQADRLLSPAVMAARKELKAKGWSYRRAAKPLRVHYSHLCLVLTGKRQSRRLLAAITNLQPAA